MIIDAGTRIRIPANAALQVESFIRVLGTEDAPVIMEPETLGGQWGGLFIDSTGAGSTVRFANIRGANQCIRSESAVTEIVRNQLTECSYGVYVRSGSPNISNNLIADNSQTGVYVYSGSPDLRFNTIDNNGSQGVYFRLTAAGSVMENNIVTTHQQGFGGDARSAARGHNNVWNNTTNYAWSAGGASDTDISSDPLYVDELRRLDDASPSKSAASNSGELGWYGNRFNVTTPTVAVPQSPVKAASITLTGNKQAGLAIGINGSEAVSANSLETWSAELSLEQGVNIFRIYAIDTDNNRSDNVTITIERDSVAPFIAASQPQNQQTVITALDNIVIWLEDLHSDVDFNTALNSLQVVGTSQGLIAGNWQKAGNRLTFTADSPMQQDQYRVTLQLKDLPLGNSVQATLVFEINDGSGGTPSGPTYSEVSFAGSPLMQGSVLTDPGSLVLTVDDPNGIDRVEMWINGELISTNNNGSSQYQFNWDIQDYSDGTHTLVIIGYDTLGNVSEQSYSLEIQLSEPDIPVLSAPGNNTVTNKRDIQVSGRGEKGSEIYLFINEQEVAGPISLNDRLAFNYTLSLNDGVNNIQALAQNRGGASDKTAVITVTSDTNIPPAPVGLIASPGEAGLVRLKWDEGTNTNLQSYRIYRSSSPFSAPESADVLQDVRAEQNSFSDYPGSDGEFYYRVAAINFAKTVGELSNQANVGVDASGPKATNIVLASDNTQNGVFGPGPLTLSLQVNEPLQGVPFLSYVQEGMSPVPVELTQNSDTEFEGTFVVDTNMQSAPVYFVFSARDLAGNRGSAIEQGSQFEIDVTGPLVTSADIAPQDPIRNDLNDTSVSVELSLDTEVGAASLSYLLSGEGRTSETVDMQLTENGWAADILLPSDAGLQGPELLSFTLIAEDQFGNSSSQAPLEVAPQVYQGDLVPLATPADLHVTSLPGGQASLVWQEVNNAAAYVIYRSNVDQSQLNELTRVTAPAFNDFPGEDGLYTYAVASLRQANGQEAVSATTLAQEVLVDSNPPAAPAGLQLELVSSGVSANWGISSASDVVGYRLYRSASEIISLQGLEAVSQTDGANFTSDYAPVGGQHYYAVTAIDAVGNESLPSSSVYLNFTLLPVNDLVVKQNALEKPKLSWTAASGANSYNVYLKRNGIDLLLNSAPLVAPEYTDTGYSGDQRVYSVAEVDENGVEGVRRTVTLPAVSFELSEPELRRGVMNHLVYQVTNHETAPLIGLMLESELLGRTHRSESFSVGPNEQKQISVVVGGYADLPGSGSLVSKLIDVSASGERAEIWRSTSYESIESSLLLELRTAEFTKGAKGKLRLRLENTGEASIDLLVAESFGSQPSGQVRALLTDLDGNVLAAQDLRFSSGHGLTVLPGGEVIARILSGSTFESQEIDIDVPQGAADKLLVKLDVLKVHHGLGTPNAITIDGLSTTREVNLRQVPYQGRLTSVTPELSQGQDVTVSGRAIDTVTELGVSFVPLQVIIAVNGFERSFDVVTDQAGDFELEFEPMSGESGQYQVSVVHPDIQDRPVQGEFAIGRLFASPTRAQLSTPRNVSENIPILVTAAGQDLTGVSLRYLADEQPLGSLLPGIEVNLPAAIDLAAGSSQPLTMTIRADQTADATGTLIFTLVSEQNPAPQQTIRVDYSLSEAVPNLQYEPGFVETGVQKGESVTETMLLGNNGLASFNNMQVALLSEGGAPAPDWIFLSTPANIGQLDVGESQAVAITASPGSDVAEGDYTFWLEVQSANGATTVLNVYVAVTESGQGGMTFKVSDIYTGTTDDGGQLIEGLAGALIKLQNERVLTVQETLTTNQKGEASFSNLPSGRYKFLATAANHQSVNGRVKIKPGVDGTTQVHLDYNLVSVEWSVREITLQDKYEIVLNAEFETDVPAPVVLMEPQAIQIPDMRKGDVEYGEITVTNYGLIRAEDIELNVPQDNDYRVEFLDGIPDTLEAKQRVTLAYKITALTDTEGADGDDSGGGCYTKTIPITIGYTYHCVNGEWRKSAITSYMTKVYGSCPGGPSFSGFSGGFSGGFGGGYGGGFGGGFGGGDGFGTSPGGAGAPPPVRPAASPLDDNVCTPEPEREAPEDCGDNNDADKSIPTNSAVNGVMREYQDMQTDMWVKVLGGRIEIKRHFYANDWHWSHNKNRLLLNRDFATLEVETIVRGGVEYKRVISSSDKLFEKEQFRIIKSDTGYRWQTPQGEWEDYDTNGRVIAFGDLKGAKARFTYQDHEAKQPNAIFDRLDNQVLWLEYNNSGQLVAVKDATDRRVAYEYSDDKLSKVTSVEDGVSTYHYGSTGQLTRKVDAENRETTITYNAKGEVSAVLLEDGSGHHFSYGYDENTKERYTRIESTSGQVREVWYEEDLDVQRVLLNDRLVRFEQEDGRVEISTDEKGNVTRTTKNQWDQPVQIVYPDQSTVLFEYESQFNLISKMINQRGVITEFSYDNLGNLQSVTEAKGLPSERRTLYEYNTNSQLVSIIRVADNQTAETRTIYQYDDKGNVAQTTDAEGEVVQYLSHDIMGNPLHIRDARGNDWVLAYDAMGRLLSMTDPLGNKTQYAYDKIGNRIWEKNALLDQIQFGYNYRNQVTETTDPLGNKYSTTYNQDGMPILVTDESGNDVLSTYDNERRLLSTYVGNSDSGYLTEYEYDDSQNSFGLSNLPTSIKYPTYSTRIYYDRLQRVVRQTDHLSDDTHESIAFEYDSMSNRLAEVDKAGRVTRYEYDGLNRLVKVIDRSGSETTYTYDDRDNLLTLTDANNGTHRFSYDGLNRQLTETLPMGGKTEYKYDANGNLVSKLDARQQVITYEYDAANRLFEEKRFNSQESESASVTIHYQYDAVGRLISYNDGTTQGQFKYDALGRKTSESINYGDFSLRHGYNYHENGNKSAFINHANEHYQYQYDAANRLQYIALPDNRRVTYNAYTWLVPNKVTYPGGNTSELTYDPLLRVKTIRSRSAAGTDLMNYSYQYDLVGNITSKATEHGNYNYQYDVMNRLTSATSPTLNDEVYSYDALGNRLSSSDTSGLWKYNLNNQLLSFDGSSFLYDANGNLSNKASAGVTSVLKHDINDRLLEVKINSSVTVKNYHDPLGRRLWKEVNGVRTYFQYSDEGVIAEFNHQGEVVKEYGFLPGSLWTTNPVFQLTSDEYYWYLNDHMGTPQKLVSNTGSEVWFARYSAFGDSSSQVNNVTNNLRLPGQYYMEETQTHYNYFRDYAPSIGRYYQVDPIRFNGGINFYQFGLANPINNPDPHGLNPVYRFGKQMVRRELEKAREKNWDRNNGGRNNVPLTEDGLKDLIECGCAKLEPVGRAIFHMQGPGGFNNKKYTLCDGREAVYDKDGNLVTDPLNRGTYNYALDDFGHVVQDVIPWILWGTGRDDAQGLGAIGDRIELSIEGALVQYMTK